MKYRLLFLILYALVGGLALTGAFVFRFYFDTLPFVYGEMMGQLLPVALGLKLISADVFGLTRAIWKYASFRDLKSVSFAAAAGSGLFIPVAWWMTQGRVPNGVLLLDGLLTFGGFTALRFSGRFWVEARAALAGWRETGSVKVLVLGGGNRAELALRVLQKGEVRVVGLLDVDPENHGRCLYGVPVLGSPDDLGRALMGREIDEVVLALPADDPAEVRRVFSLASAAGARVSILPEVSPLEQGSTLNPIREVQMSDFLGRAPVQLDPEPLRQALTGQRVLVTGAGGSIGSELCRQISRFPLAELVLLDFSETALFEVSEEVRSQKSEVRGEGRGQRVEVRGPEEEKGSARASSTFSPTEIRNCENVNMHGLTPFAFVLCDIRDRQELEAVFAEHRPQVVIHAAACKHVPLMEAHPLEAARTNVLGTRNVVEVARGAGVMRLMHVSTDKAVNPEGVMGASKAWSERIVRDAGYSCVRFGNVLGSSGSVIPLFEKQWSRSGTLQVTHKDATRYFMTIEEAVQLILHAEALQNGGELYVLDMGEPVSILALANQLIALKRGKAESIEITGLRPGERLHERLHTEEEELKPTTVSKLRRVAPAADGIPLDHAALQQALTELEELLAVRDVAGVREWLMRTSPPAATTSSMTGRSRI